MKFCPKAPSRTTFLSYLTTKYHLSINARTDLCQRPSRLAYTSHPATTSIPRAGVRASPRVHSHMEEDEIPEENRVSHREKERGYEAYQSGRQPAVSATFIYNPQSRLSNINPLKWHVKCFVCVHMHHFLGRGSSVIILSQRAQEPRKSLAPFSF